MSEWDAFPAAAVEIPPQGRALLDTIAGSESPGYNTLYGGGQFSDFADHPRQAVPITTGPNAGKTSSAAGRYQFLGSTWDQVKNDLQLPDFSPENQDIGAWHLANKTYLQKTGRDLASDLEKAKGNPGAVNMIGSYLSGQWTSLPKGIEPNNASNSFGTRYASNLNGGQGNWDAFPMAPDAPQQPAPLQHNTGGLSDRVAREGMSPPVATAGEAAQGGFLRGATFNFRDELNGLATAGGLDPNDPDVVHAMAALVKGAYRKASGDPEADAAYRVRVSQDRAEAQRQREQQPGASIAGELGGALATLPFGGAAKAGTLREGIAQGAKTGAIYGGVSGIGEGTDLSSRASGGATGAALGATLGAAIPVALAPFASRASAPTIQALKDAAETGYQSPEVKNLVIKGSAVSDLSQTIQTSLNKIGIDENLAPKTFGILAKLEKAPPGAQATGDNLNSVRRIFGNAANSADATERKAAKEAIEALDNFVPNVAAKDVVAGDPAAAAAKWAEARGNYAAAMRSENIDKKTIQAELRAAAANSGQNVANTVRQRMADVLLKPAERRGYSAGELAQMETIVRGTAAGNALRFTGNLLGGGGGLGAVVAAGAGGLATGGPGAIAPVVGFALKALGNRMTLRQTEKLSEAVRSRAPLANSMGAFGTKVQAFQQARSPATIAAVSLAARNLSNNLKDAGIMMTPADLLRALQSPVAGRADQDQQGAPGLPAQ